MALKTKPLTSLMQSSYPNPPNEGHPCPREGYGIGIREYGLVPNPIQDVEGVWGGVRAAGGRVRVGRGDLQRPQPLLPARRRHQRAWPGQPCAKPCRRTDNIHLTDLLQERLLSVCRSRGETACDAMCTAAAWSSAHPGVCCWAQCRPFKTFELLGQVCQAAATPCQLSAVCDGANRDCTDPAIAPAGSECGPGCLCDGVSEGMPIIRAL